LRNSEEEVDSIPPHFDLMQLNEMGKFSIDELEFILNQKSLAASSEDSFYQIVCDQMESIVIFSLFEFPLIWNFFPFQREWMSDFIHNAWSFSSQWICLIKSNL
jgi:hypothetical protein